MNEQEKIALCARVAHEANKAYCECIGDMTQAHWDAAPEWQKTSAIKGVIGVLAGNTPRQSHESWLKEKRETGWVYGPIKNADKKEHPCFVDYDMLPPEQKVKDAVFVSVVRAMAKSVGLGK